MRRLPFVLAAGLVAGAILLPSPALAAPPLSLHAVNLNGAEIAIPSGLQAERTLLLMGFRHEDRDALDGWREGLGLAEADAGWLEIPVIPVKNPMIQPMIQGGMRKHFPTEALRAHVAPLFADPAPVAASLGVGLDAPALVVVDRGGRVLARAAGSYDPAKAKALLTALHDVR